MVLPKSGCRILQPDLGKIRLVTGELGKNIFFADLWVQDSATWLRQKTYFSAFVCNQSWGRQIEIRKQKYFCLTIFWRGDTHNSSQAFFGGPSAFQSATASHHSPLGLPTMAGVMALGTDHDEAMCGIRLLYILFRAFQNHHGVWSLEWSYCFMTIMIYNHNHDIILIVNSLATTFHSANTLGKGNDIIGESWLVSQTKAYFFSLGPHANKHILGYSGMVPKKKLNLKHYLSKCFGKPKGKHPTYCCCSNILWIRYGNTIFNIPMFFSTRAPQGFDI